MEPEVVKFCQEFPSALFIKLDVDKVLDVKKALGIRAFPTFIIFKGGQKVRQVEGANPTKLREVIEEAVSAEFM